MPIKSHLCKTANPRFVVRKGIKYLVMQGNGPNKQVYKYNSSSDTFVPSAGLVQARRSGLCGLQSRQYQDLG